MLIRGLLTAPVCTSVSLWPSLGQLLLALRSLNLSNLLLELLVKLALETVESRAEVTKDVLSAEAVSRGVIRGVYRVLYHKRMMVHLTQLIE